MFHNKTFNVVLLFSLFVLSSCGGVFESADMSFVTTYKSLTDEQSTNSISVDPLDQADQGITEDDEIPIEKTPVEINSRIKARCEFGEIDMINLVLTCQSGHQLILTAKDSLQEQLVKNFGVIDSKEAIKNVIAEIKNLKINSEFVGDDLDVFLCLDSTKNNQCTDEQILELNELNAGMMALQNMTLDVLEFIGQTPNHEKFNVCETGALKSLAKGLLIYHQHFSLNGEADSLRNRVAGAVQQYLEQIQEMNAASMDPEEGLNLSLVLGMADREKCPKPNKRTNGCFAEGTQISLNKSIALPVEKLKAGDQVMLANGGYGRIKQVVKGPEKKPMVELTMEKGQKLFITQDHPMITDLGITTAEKLKVGHRMKLKTGQWSTISKLELKNYEGQVYNFRLAGEGIQAHSVIANEIATGDLDLQESLKPKTPLKQLAKKPVK